MKILFPRPLLRRVFAGVTGVVALGLMSVSAQAVVVSYIAADASLNANIVSTGVFDNGSSMSPFSVSASYPAPGEGSPSGNASASVTTLSQSLSGFQIQGSLSGTSVAGSSQSLGVESAASSQYYGFTISGPTLVYLRANYSRSITGFDPGVGFFKANVCAATGPCPASGVDGLGTGILGGVSFTGTTLETAVMLAGGSYLLDFYAYDKVFGNTPGGTGTFSDSYNVQLQFTPFEAVVPVPAAAWLFGSALGFMGLVRRKINN